ncbi:MAG: hypothetical protein IKP34_01485, partial [Bacteroidales bacterium]|nr:hypothetical protein [Bacteroidales bacterium]
CLTVRHTPAFGHPTPRGDGRPHHFNCQCLESVALPRHPLSERGAAKRRGVSHHRASTIRGVSHYETIINQPM